MTIKLNIRLKSVRMAIALLLGSGAITLQAEEVVIVHGNTTDRCLRTAAAELKLLLGEVYPNDTFTLGTRIPEERKYILFGTLDSQRELKKYIRPADVDASGSFIVKQVEGGRAGVVCGNHSRAVLDGVYAVLEHLGYAFYLEYNIMPEPRETFSFDNWSLRDTPVVQDRFLFNWHNFISGCTGWNFDHYKKWILQASRMGYNGIKLHFYGNNPAFQFTFNGQTKPVGYMGATHKGPEWSVPLLNDVRRLPGAGFLDNPVFASDVALVDDDQRVDAAVKLLQQAMEYADSLGMKIHLGVDMDHRSCNPQNIIQTLPEHVRFKHGTLVRPDTPEGHEYYKAQFKTLLDLYPQLDTIIVWSRGEWTEWMTLSYEDLPEAWQKEYDAFKKKHPLNTRHPWGEYNSPKDKGPAHFAYTKITTEALEIVKELGREDLEIGYGGWWPRTSQELWRLHNFVENPSVSLWVKDYSRDFANEKVRKVYKEISETRKIYPVDWAHHDDGHYVGRPFLPHPNFGNMLKESNVAGYGIVHWMTWPLDIFIKNLMHQAWEGTLNESYETTCYTMAEQVFGAAYKDVMGAYLTDWWSNAPNFGFSTSPQYMRDKKTGEINVLIGADRYLPETLKRIESLEEIDTSEMSPSARKYYQYFLLNEKFIAGIADSSIKLTKARSLIRNGEFAAARELMKTSRHTETVELFSRAARSVGPSRGEAGHLIRMASVWLFSYDYVWGQLGLQPIGYNFGPIPFDEFAIGAANQKFYFDREGLRWSVHDALLIENGGQITKTKSSGIVESDGKTINLDNYTAKEISGLPAASTTAEEVAATYVESVLPIQLKLKAGTEKLLPGTYSVELYFPASLVSKEGERRLKISLPDQTIETDLYADGAEVKTISFADIDVKDSFLPLTVEGLQGNAIISGAKLILESEL